MRTHTRTQTHTHTQWICCYSELIPIIFLQTVTGSTLDVRESHSGHCDPVGFVTIMMKMRVWLQETGLLQTFCFLSDKHPPTINSTNAERTVDVPCQT